jgi:hypothetical protein
MVDEYDRKLWLEEQKNKLKSEDREDALEARKEKVDYETRNKLETEEHISDLKVSEHESKALIDASFKNEEREADLKNRSELLDRKLAAAEEGRAKSLAVTQDIANKNLQQRAADTQKRIDMKMHELARKDSDKRTNIQIEAATQSEISNREIAIAQIETEKELAKVRAEILHSRDMLDREHVLKLELEEADLQKQLTILSHESEIRIAESKVTVKNDIEIKAADTKNSLILLMGEIVKMNVEHENQKDLMTHAATLKAHFGEFTQEELAEGLRRLEEADRETVEGVVFDKNF